jgi:predicted DNA-binding transcriptional regulator AlpA
LTTTTDEDRSLSIAELCEIENFSLSTYYKLRKLGLAPREMRPLPGLVRIARSEHRAWRERMQQHNARLDAQLERRRAQCVEAGRASVESPIHVSKAGRGRNKRRTTERTPRPRPRVRS